MTHIKYLTVASVFLVVMMFAAASKAEGVSFKNAIVIPGASVQSIDGEGLPHRPTKMGVSEAERFQFHA